MNYRLFDIYYRCSELINASRRFFTEWYDRVGRQEYPGRVALAVSKCGKLWRGMSEDEKKVSCSQPSCLAYSVLIKDAAAFHGWPCDSQSRTCGRDKGSTRFLIGLCVGILCSHSACASLAVPSPSILHSPPFFYF